MNDFLDKLKDSIGRLSGRQRVQLVLAIAGTLGLVWGFTAYANRIQYGVLFSNLSRDDASRIVAELRNLNVDYRLTAGGTMVEVPAGSVDELRLDLAGEGLPPGGGVGFELFDKPAFGMSDFVQNVNYKRALERELSRTIQSLDVVESARVHLALPAETVFAEEQRKPSASVVVRLSSGRSLPQNRVRAVANLVASGVEGMEPSSVSVIDGEGRMLSAHPDENGQMASSTQVEARNGLERNIESTLVSILEPIVGPGRVRARATVELNMTRVERVQETFDPAGAVVRSEEKSKSTQQGGGGVGGVPGTASNLPGGSGPRAAGGSDKNQTQTSRTNFEINKTVSTISEPVGQLVRQSVAVVVDHARVPIDDEGGGETPAPTPRTPEEMRQITELVSAAIGYDQNRGDQLIVQNIPFENGPTDDGGAGFDWGLVTTILRFVSLPLAVLLLALLIFKPAFATIRSMKQLPEGIDGAMAPTVAQLQAQLGGSGALSGDSGTPMRQRLIQAVQEDPQTAALVIRSWMDPQSGKE